MDTTIETIQKLRRYAAQGIDKLTSQDALLRPINELVQKYINKSSDTSTPIDDETAKKLVLWSAREQIFTDDEVRHFHMIGKKILEIAVQPTSNNDHLLQVALYLRPLLSRDSRTSAMGFDLDEYMDWYFKDLPQKEREENAKKLMDDWHFDD